VTKPVRLYAHARSYRNRRDFTAPEVKEAIRTAPSIPAERGKLNCRKNFEFEKTWNGTWYNTKQVRPVFVEESDEIVVVTVYTYYF